MKVLFVCTGNTCRSPMAAAYLRSKNIPELTVKSRGLYADGSSASDHAVAVMRELGIDLSAHRSAQLTERDLDADLIFCLSATHRDALLSAGVDSEKLTVLGHGISDPYGGSEAIYRRCRNEIITAIDRETNCGTFTEYTVTEMEDDDIPQVAELERECFSEPWSENALRESLAAGTHFFAAKENGSVLGYVGVSAILDEGYITNVAVFPAARKRGVGSLLVARVMQLAREQKLAFVSLEVRASNFAARRLYERFSFAPVGTRKSFYRDPVEDAIIMTKRLDDPDEDIKH